MNHKHSASNNNEDGNPEYSDLNTETGSGLTSRQVQTKESTWEVNC